MKILLLQYLLITTNICSGQTNQLTTLRTEFMNRPLKVNKVEMNLVKRHQSYAPGLVVLILGTALVGAGIIYSPVPIDRDTYFVIGLGGFFQICGGYMLLKAHRYNVRDTNKIKMDNF